MSGELYGLLTKVQMFVNEGLSITMAIRWPNIIKPLSCGKLQERSL